MTSEHAAVTCFAQCVNVGNAQNEESWSQPPMHVFYANPPALR
jgi:hypothetical protein